MLSEDFEVDVDVSDTAPMLVSQRCGDQIGYWEAVRLSSMQGESDHRVRRKAIGLRVHGKNLQVCLERRPLCCDVFTLRTANQLQQRRRRQHELGVCVLLEQVSELLCHPRDITMRPRRSVDDPTHPYTGWSNASIISV